MRLLLSRDSNKKLFDFLIKTNHCNSLKELACKMKIHFRTVQKWRYSENYIPEKIIPSEIKNNLKITDRQEDNWGRVKGGKITHKIILQKYGKIEIKKRQIRGGEKSIKEKIKKTVNPTNTQITCLLKKSPPFSSGAKLFIVTRPDKMMGRMKKTKSQSIRFRTFSAINLPKFHFKNIVHRNYLFSDDFFCYWFRPSKVNICSFFCS